MMMSFFIGRPDFGFCSSPDGSSAGPAGFGFDAMMRLSRASGCSVCGRDRRGAALRDTLVSQWLMEGFGTAAGRKIFAG